MVHVISGRGDTLTSDYNDQDDIVSSIDSDSRCCEASFWVKYFLFGFNFLVWVAGSVFIGVGIWARLQKQGLDPLDHLVTDPAYIMIGVGGVMFIVSFFGCIGSLRENLTLLKIFCVVVVIIFIIQLVCGVLAFVFVDKIERNILDYMRHSITHYDENEDIKDLIDRVQTQYSCCGAASYNDWDTNVYYNCSSKAASRCGVPMSCCVVPNDLRCGFNTRGYGKVYASGFIHTTGCIHALMVVFRENLIVIGIVAFAVGFLELFSLLLAHNLIRSIMLNGKSG